MQALNDVMAELQELSQMNADLQVGLRLEKIPKGSLSCRSSCFVVERREERWQREEEEERLWREKRRRIMMSMS